MRYRFTLERINCITQRSAAEYRDAIDVSFVLSKPFQDASELSAMASVLGLPGPNRFGPLFGPGTSVSLEPNPNRFGYGFERPWSLEIDVPDDGGNVSIGIILNNHRGVDDPFKFTKTVLSLAAAAGMGAAGGVAGKEAAKALGAVLAGGLGGLVGEGLKKALEKLFGDDWPDCTGTVFRFEKEVNLADIQGMPSNVTLPSMSIGPSQGGCKNPKYTVEMSVRTVDEPQLQFGNPAQIRKTVYTPLVTATGSDWKGTWTSDSSDPVPFVRLNIKSDRVRPIDQVALDPPARFIVNVTERVEGRSELHSAVEVGPVVVNSEPGFKYHGAVVIGVAKRVPTATQTPVDQTVESVPRTPQVDRVTVINNAAWVGAVARAAGAEQGHSVLLPLPTSVEDDLNALVNNVRDIYGNQQSVLLATEEGPTIRIPDLSVTLRLYTRTDTYNDGREVSNRVLRYERTDTSRATYSDHELQQGNGPVF